MKRLTAVGVLLLLTACVNVSVHTGSKPGEKSIQPAPGESMSDSAVASGVNAFALDLYRELAGDPGNLVSSPLSISTLLVSLTPGAVGPTQTEMLRVLHRSASAGPGDRELLSGLDARAHEDSTSWTVANRAWVQSGFEISPAFTTTTHDIFGYDMGEADFVHAPDPSRGAINQWIDQQTKGRIRDLFPQGSISSATRLVLANAIYFKGLWKIPFGKDNTTPKSFYVQGSDPASVPMMQRGGSFAFAKLPHAQMIELPYRGDHLSMLVLLPDEHSGLGALEKGLDAEIVRSWVSLMSRREVNLWIPRFKSESKWNLEPALAKLGIRFAFNPAKADFSAIAKGHDLFLSSVYHGAFVEVNEEGTEAAAATGGVVSATSMPVVRESFVADHPFLYLIRDRATGCILFIGRVVDPRS